MREELKEKISDLIWRERDNDSPDSLSDSELTGKIADLIDQDQTETSIDDSYAHLKDSFDKLDQALDEHFAVIDKIKDVLKPTPKVKEVIHGE